MQLNDVKEWKNQHWTRLYESALFERDTVRLCACLWDAQVAILSRKKQIRGNSAIDLREQFALRKALIILADLRRLAGFGEDRRKAQRRGRPYSVSPNTPKSVRSGTRATKRTTVTK
jgi:hypothetical protein